MISHTNDTGRYCIGGLPFVPRSAMVATDSRDAPISNMIAAVTTTRGTPVVGCPAGFDQVRVSMTQVNNAEAPAGMDQAFYLWIQQ